MLDFTHEIASKIAQEMLAQTTRVDLYIKEAHAIAPYDDQADQAERAIADFETIHGSDCFNWTKEEFDFYMNKLWPQRREAQDILYRVQEFTSHIRRAWEELEEA